MGPLEASEIVKDKDFNGQSLICPENESENEESWKYPADYAADFGKFPAAPAPAPARKPSSDQKTARAEKLIEEFSPEDTIHSRSPITAPLEDNLLEDLPSSALLANKKAESMPKEQTSVDGGNIVLENAAPKTVKEEPQTNLMASIDPLDIFKKQTLTPEHGSGAVKVPAAAGKIGMMPLPTTDGKILSAQDPRQNPSKKSDTIYILFAVMFVVVAIALFMTIFQKNTPPSPQQPAPAETQQDQPARPQPALQGIDEGLPSPAAKQEPVSAPALTQQGGSIAEAAGNTAGKAIAQQMVKEYLLDERRGNIDEFFRKTYKDYNTSWSSERLYQDSFVVYFHASKVRQEPIRYMFNVNIKNRQIKGMNNIAMDLLSK